MASELFVADVFGACTNIETVEVTTPKDLYLFAPLPGRSRVRTLILRHPLGATLSQEQLVAWNLLKALEDGLFAVGTTQPWIIIRSGTPDPTKLLEAGYDCEHFNVEALKLLCSTYDDARRSQ